MIIYIYRIVSIIYIVWQKKEYAKKITHQIQMKRIKISITRDSCVTRLLFEIFISSGIILIISKKKKKNFPAPKIK